MRTLSRRFLLESLVIRASHRDDVYSYTHGQMHIGFVCISGHHSRLLANLLALFELALQREHTRLAHVQPSKLSIAEQSSTYEVVMKVLNYEVNLN